MVGLYGHVGVTCLSGFVLGYNLCIIGSVLVFVQRSLELCYPCEGGTTDHDLDTCNCQLKSFAVSAVSIGAIIGGLLGGVVSDLLGRRVTLILVDGLFISGSICMAVAHEAPLFFCGRLLVGLAGGGCSVASTYISEIAPPEIRGMLVEMNEFALCFGCLTSAIVAAALGNDFWRYAVALPVVPALLQIFCMIFLHESPTWLAMHERAKPAMRAAEALWGQGASGSEELAERMKGGHGRSLSLSALWSNKRPLLLALGCGVAHAITATNTVLYYSRNLLATAGVRRPLLAVVAVTSLKLAGVGICIASVERVGRRRLLIAGTCGIILGHVGFVASFANDENPLDMLALASMFIFILSWNISWSGLMLVVAAEILPDTIRGFGLGVTYSIYWFISGLEEQTLHRLFLEFSVAGTFSFYGGLSCLSLLFVLRCLKETGKEPLQVEDDESDFTADESSESVSERVR